MGLNRTTLPSGGGGIVINNYFSGDVSGEEIVDKVERSLTTRLQRRGAIFNGRLTAVGRAGVASAPVDADH